MYISLVQVDWRVDTSLRTPSIMSFCKNCIKGASSASPCLLHPNNHIHQASPTKELHRVRPPSIINLLTFYPLSGKWELIGGVNSYVATPTIDYPKDKVVLLLTDVFGPQLVNAQLLADDFAGNGFKVRFSPFPLFPFITIALRVDCCTRLFERGPYPR